MLTRSKPLTILAMLFSGLLPLCAQDNSDQAKLSDFEWLQGMWQKQSSRRIVFETWEKVSPATFEGLSFVVDGADTMITEYLRLEQFGNEIFYTAVVSHNPSPVPFKLVRSEDSTFVFENLGHDFPQRIQYYRKSDTNIHVRIEGEQDGGITGVDFYFRKIEDRK